MYYTSLKYHPLYSVLCEIKEKTVLSLRNLNDEVRAACFIFHHKKKSTPPVFSSVWPKPLSYLPQDPPDPQLMRLDNMLIAEVRKRPSAKCYFVKYGTTWHDSHCRELRGRTRMVEPLDIPHRSLHLVTVLKISRVSSFFVALLEQEKLLTSVSEWFWLLYNDLIQNQTWWPLKKPETPKHLWPLNPPLANLKSANNLSKVPLTTTKWFKSLKNDWKV